MKMLKVSHGYYKCLDCGNVGGIKDDDTCLGCGERYNPQTQGETCPFCGNDEYESHCEKCDSTEIEYYYNYLHYKKFGEYDNFYIPKHEFIK